MVVGRLACLSSLSFSLSLSLSFSGARASQTSAPPHAHAGTHHHQHHPHRSYCRLAALGDGDFAWWPAPPFNMSSWYAAQHRSVRRLFLTLTLTPNPNPNPNQVRGAAPLRAPPLRAAARERRHRQLHRQRIRPGTYICTWLHLAALPSTHLTSPRRSVALRLSFARVAAARRREQRPLAVRQARATRAGDVNPPPSPLPSTHACPCPCVHVVLPFPWLSRCATRQARTTSRACSYAHVQGAIEHVLRCDCECSAETPAQPLDPTKPQDGAPTLLATRSRHTHLPHALHTHSTQIHTHSTRHSDACAATAGRDGPRSIKLHTADQALTLYSPATHAWCLSSVHSVGELQTRRRPTRTRA